MKKVFILLLNATGGAAVQLLTRTDRTTTTGIASVKQNYQTTIANYNNNLNGVQ